MANSQMQRIRPLRRLRQRSGSEPAPPKRRRGATSTLSVRLITIAPAVVLFAAFIIQPIIQLVRMSFSNVQMLNGRLTYHPNGAVNYEMALTSPQLLNSAWLTIVFALATVGLSVSLGTLLALLVNRAVILSKLAGSILLWPALIAPVVVSVTWFLILSPQIGGLNKTLSVLGIPGQSWLADEFGAMASVILLDTWHWTPLVFVLVYAGVLAVEPEYFEAARIDGASEFQIYRKIVLPLLAPTIAAAALLRLTMGAKAFDEFYLLTHGGPGDSTRLVSLYIRDVFFDQLKFGAGASISILVVVAVLIVIGLVLIGRGLTRMRQRGTI